MTEQGSFSGFVIGAIEKRSLVFTDFELIRETPVNVIYRAKRDGQWWILKGLAPDKVGIPFFDGMLWKESQILLEVQQPGHPAIVKTIGMEMVKSDVLDRYEGHQAQFIIMEQIVGRTLRELLDEKIRRKERRRYALELVDALSYLHSINVVHRDLKPSNIMVTKNGQTLKLIDFGLSDTDYFSVLKQPAGTEGYISPEQREGMEADVRNDIYSLGVILREMDLGPMVRRIADRCTKPRQQRYQNMGEVTEAFERLRNLRNTIASWLLVALLALMAIGGAFWYWYTHRPLVQTFHDMRAWEYTEEECFRVESDGVRNTVHFTGGPQIEPAHCPLNVVKGRRYRITVDYSGPAYEPQKAGDCSFMIMVRENVPRRVRNNSGVMSSHTIPVEGAKHKTLSVDFTATDNQMYIRINFGWVRDSIPYTFHFDNWKLEELPDIDGAEVDYRHTITLQHEATGLYMRNNGEGMASLGKDTMSIDMTPCGKGYIIDTHEYDPGDGVEERYLNYHDVEQTIFSVGDVAQAWYFIRQPDGCYALQNDSYLFATYNGKDSVLQMMPLDKNSHNTHWKIVKRSEKKPVEDNYYIGTGKGS